VNLLEKQLRTVYFKDVSFPWVTLYFTFKHIVFSHWVFGIAIIDDFKVHSDTDPYLPVQVLVTLLPYTRNTTGHTSQDL